MRKFWISEFTYFGGVSILAGYWQGLSGFVAYNSSRDGFDVVLLVNLVLGATNDNFDGNLEITSFWG